MKFVVLAFLLALAACVLMLQGKVMAGAVSYALFALVGASTFIWLAYAKGDRTHNVDEYRSALKSDDLHDQLGGGR